MYRQDCFNGMVEYQIFDSNKCLIVRVEIVAGYAGAAAEEAMTGWLDLMDPDGTAIAPGAFSDSLPVSSDLAA